MGRPQRGSRSTPHLVRLDHHPQILLGLPEMSGVLHARSTAVKLCKSGETPLRAFFLRALSPRDPPQEEEQ
ncbi:OLC1v1012740C1 [Oldenlandia corymbosa var. corymbosa]|uniref:OLC1v1012740C1 n=1 Tax=Oldenlandia corymbosa var. corymbosa TaxID=529605 RepID=A0AAV1E055_OLDCO|nr:OLC1v1012740C1 [Oldenlandia corymbosa var. corymbosa]